MMLYQMFGKPQHQELLSELESAHFHAALSNDNTSSAIAVATYRASGDIGRAIAAAAMAQGGLHAPIAKARALLEAAAPRATAQAMIDAGKRVPGFGNSFYKTHIDPAFQSTHDMLPECLRELLWQIGGMFASRLSPNAAIITAAACIVAKLPAGVEPAVFVHARTPAWVQLCLKAKMPEVGTP